MKTSEFIRRVEELGYEVLDNDDLIIIYDDYGSVTVVYENKVNVLDTNRNGKDVPDELFDLCVEYAKTPIEERKDVKKYYFYNRARNAYFNYDVLSKTYYWLDPTKKHNIQTQFTEEEIENHKFRDIMELLEKVEVE